MRSTSCYLIVLTTDGQVLQVNGALLRALGYEAEELVERSELSMIVPQEERARWSEQTTEAVERDQTSTFAGRLVAKDGRELVVEWQGLRWCRPPEGRPSLLALGYNVTEHKKTVETVETLARGQAEQDLRQSEERYRDLVENLDDVVFSVGAEGRVLYMSGAVKKYGYTPEEVVGQSFSRFVHPEDLPTLQTSFLQTLSGRSVPFEYRIFAKDGEVRIVRSTSRPVLDDGRPTGLTGVLVDVTEQRQTEEQLRHALKLEAIGLLAGGVAHDFNNFLNVIIGYSDFTLDNLEEGHPARAYLAKIRKAGESATALTRQLLAFSRKQMLKPEVLDLNQIIRSSGAMIERLLGEQIDQILLLEDDLGSVEADPGQLEQVMLNLAVNARDAMVEGGKLIIKTANITLSEDLARKYDALNVGPHVMVSVSDTGCGMDQRTQEHIFDPFFTTKGQGKGTGLGMSTVYGIIKQSGGSIWVSSEPGKGATFEIYLPRVDAPVTESVRRPSLVAAAGHEHVLVVEDEENVLKLVERILTAAGYRVFTASNGGEALLIFEKQRDSLDLLLTDVVMPHLNGRELADRLLQICPKLKVLFMSGYTNDAIAQQGILDQNTRFIQKPFSAGELKQKVREVLDEGPEG